MSPELWARIRSVTDEHDDVELTTHERVAIWAIEQNERDLW